MIEGRLSKKLALTVLALTLGACGQPQTAGLPEGALTPAEQGYRARLEYLQSVEGEEDSAEDSTPQPVRIQTKAGHWNVLRPMAVVEPGPPIILVPGFLSYDRQERPGKLYWGGIDDDLEADLRSAGYAVYAANIAPLSSNWDRAAELFAQIKGGCVDYGAARAAQFGHQRFDTRKCYPGLYPQWDAQHPVHLVGHSMGGLTSRMLVKLLEDGSPANAEGSNLFTGGRFSWVRSVTTLATPNNGSPAADKLQDMMPVFQKLVLRWSTSSDNGGATYDFDLGQYHLERQPGEKIGHYSERVFNSGIVTSQDSAAWDLRPDGTKALNDFMGRSPFTKYFSWALNNTRPGKLWGWHHPEKSMDTELKVIAYPYPWPMKPGLGNVKGSSEYGAVQYDKSWWPSDGVVPTNYMNAPIGQGSEVYVGQATRGGQWYEMGLLSGLDHFAITQQSSDFDLKPFYHNLAAFLNRQ